MRLSAIAAAAFVARGEIDLTDGQAAGVAVVVVDHLAS